MSPRNPFLLVATLAASLLLAAACGGSSDDSDAAVASLDTDTTSTPDAESTPTDEELGDLWSEAVLDFSACVRTAGVEDFPDLDSTRITSTDGFFTELQAAGVDPTEADVSDAMTQCGDVLAAVVQLAPGPTADELQALEEAGLAIMACIRENGYPDVPDLDLTGGLGAEVVLQLVPYVDVTDLDFQKVAGDCVASSPVDFDGRDSIAAILGG